MKIKKYLALMLTLVMFISCVNIKVSAENPYEEITVSGIGENTGTYYKFSVSSCQVNSSPIPIVQPEVNVTYMIKGRDSFAPKITTIEIYDGSTNVYTAENVNSIEKEASFSYSGSAPSSLTAKIYYEVSSYALTSASSLATEGGVTFKVNNNTVTTSVSGATVTASAIAVEGYEAKLSSSDVCFISNANGVATFSMPSKAVTVTATYTPYAYLDLEESNTYADSKDIDQNYTLIQDGDTTYTDSTKVKVEWTLPDISATYTSNKTWNPDTLSWDETKSTAALGEKTATFTFTNYSSVAVGAKVSFSKAIGTESTPFASNVLTLQSVLDPNTHEQIYSEVSGSIKHVYTPNAADFNSLEAGEGKYGTYTISIVAAVKVDFDLQGQGEAIADQYVGIGGLVKAVTNPVADDYTFGGWYTDAACSLGNEWNFNTSTVSKATTLYAKWLAK